MTAPPWSDHLGSPFTVLVASGTDDGADELVSVFERADAVGAVATAADRAGVERVLDGRSVDAIVCEHAPPALDALEILSLARDRDPSVPVVVYAPEVDIARDAFRADATDVVPTSGDVDYELLAGRVTDAVRDRRQLDRYREIFDQASEGIVVHDPETGDILEANERFYEMLCLDSDDELTMERITPADGTFSAAEGRRYIRDVPESGTETTEWRDTTADGEAFWVEVSARRATVGGEECVLSFVRETTERHRYEQQYEATRERLEGVVSRIDDGFFAVDDDWEFTFVNERAATLLDSDAESLVGENVWEAFPSAVGSEFQTRYEQALDRQESVTFEEYFAPLDLWVEVEVYPSPDGLSVFFRDVSDRKYREQALSGLLDVTRDLMRADDEQAVATLVSDAATEILDHEFNGVRLYDPERNELVVEAASLAETRETVPTADLDDDTFLGAVFETGESAIYDDLSAETDADYAFVASAMVLPLGEFGTLSIGTAETAAFDDMDLWLAQLLAANATAAFERVRRQQDLERYEAVLESSEGMVCALDREGRLTLVTDPLASLLGYDTEEMIGTVAGRLFAEGDAAEWHSYVDELLAGGRLVDAFETTLARADGTDIPVEIEVSRLTGDGETTGVVAVVRDIGELVATRQRVSAQRERFRHLFASLPDPVVEVRLDDRTVTASNGAFTDVFGFESADVVGDPVEEFVVHPDGREREDTIDFPAIDEQPRVREIERRTADGPRTFLFRAIPYERDGVAVAFCVYTDITQQKERERYLGVLNRLVRHNLRNALDVMLGNAAEIERLADDSTVRAHAADIADQVDALDDLTETARTIEDVFGERGDDSGDVDVVPMLTRLAERHRQRLGDGDITVDLPDTLRVAGNAHLERAFDELLENAVGHAVSAPEIRISAAYDDADWVRVSISDDGPGIPDEEWQVVTGDQEITQLSHGTGLGLWLVRWVVVSCGGHLHRESAGEGTTVVVELPHRTSPQTRNIAVSPD